MLRFLIYMGFRAKSFSRPSSLQLSPSFKTKICNIGAKQQFLLAFKVLLFGGGSVIESYTFQRSGGRELGNGAVRALWKCFERKQMGGALKLKSLKSQLTQPQPKQKNSSIQKVDLLFRKVIDH